jgi:hypothetical protein
MYKQNEIVIADCLKKLVTSIKGTVDHSKREIVIRNIWNKEISRHIALEIIIDETDALQEPAPLTLTVNDNPATFDSETLNSLQQ